MSSKRDEWIVNQRLVHNRTFDSIGHDVGLGRERVRQIVKAHERKKQQKVERDRRHKIRLEALNYWLRLLRDIKAAEVKR